MAYHTRMADLTMRDMQRLHLAGQRLMALANALNSTGLQGKPALLQLLGEVNADIETIFRKGSARPGESSEAREGAQGERRSRIWRTHRRGDGSRGGEARAFAGAQRSARRGRSCADRRAGVDRARDGGREHAGGARSDFRA